MKLKTLLLAAALTAGSSAMVFAQTGTSGSAAVGGRVGSPSLSANVGSGTGAGVRTKRAKVGMKKSSKAKMRATTGSGMRN